MTIPDLEIIEGCLQGERKAQKMLFNKYYRRFLGICMRYSHTNAEAEDMLVTGFMNIFRNIASYEKKGTFEGWMKRIIVNNAIDQYRKNLRHAVTEHSDDLPEDTPATGPLPDELPEEQILSLLQRLPAGYRTVFNLFAIEGYEHKEIALMLGISENTSKTQLFKARRMLQRFLTEFGSDKSTFYTDGKKIA